MQTFLPIPDIVKTSQILDRLRLGKQRVESKQILFLCYLEKGMDYRLILEIKNPEKLISRYSNHPAVLMWHGFEKYLAFYGFIMCDEWINRGYVDNLQHLFLRVLNRHEKEDYLIPNWFGNHFFHESHQSNLVRKYPDYYKIFFPEVPDNLPYFWPTKEK